jgi:hypothetical protein
MVEVFYAPNKILLPFDVNTKYTLEKCYIHTLKKHKAEEMSAKIPEVKIGMGTSCRTGLRSTVYHCNYYLKLSVKV